MKNREIKFKAKRIDNGEWVEGYLLSDQVKRDGNPSVDIMLIQDELHQEWEINPETICQYTGLKDKNGKEIWEGDGIVSCGNQSGNVVYEHGTFGIRTQGSNSKYPNPFTNMNLSYWKVIGNIHDEKGGK